MAKSTAILDDDEPLPPRRSRETRESAREGFEWGLASTILGAVFLVLGPLGLLMLMASGYDRNSASRGESTSFEITFLVTLVGSEALCVASPFFGLRGLSRARADRTPTALPVTGILLSMAAIVVWLLVALVTLSKDL